jgi:hypothetical protein
VTAYAHAAAVLVGQHGERRRFEPVGPDRHEVAQRRPIDQRQDRGCVLLGERARAVHGGQRTVGAVVRLDEVANLATELPEVTEAERWGNHTWLVAGKAFAWERPFSKADIKRFGETAPPDGPILAVRVEDLGEKQAALAAQPEAFFTIPHFDGYAAVLIQLRKVTKRALREALLDGWLAVAPPALAEQYLARRSTRRR